MTQYPASRLRTVAKLFSILAGFALMCLSVTSGRAQNRPAASGNAATGKALFASKTCNQCHGATGEGTAAGPKLAGDPITMAAFVSQVRMPMDKMPPMNAAMVSDAQLADIYAYLHTLSGATPAPPAAAAVSVDGSGERAQNGAKNLRGLWLLRVPRACRAGRGHRPAPGAESYFRRGHDPRTAPPDRYASLHSASGLRFRDQRHPRLPGFPAAAAQARQHSAAEPIEEEKGSNGDQHVCVDIHPHVITTEHRALPKFSTRQG